MKSLSHDPGGGDLDLRGSTFPPRIGRILVVDDEPEHVSALGEFLTSKGYEVSGAHSGREALNMLEPSGFDLAFVDIRMPGMSGLELISRMRADNPGLPVVIMTAYSTVDSAVEAFRIGASDFMAKPLRLAEIESTLEKLVHRKSGSAGVDSLLTVLEGQGNGEDAYNLSLTMKNLKELTALREKCQPTGDSDTLYSHLASAASDMHSSGQVVVSVIHSDSGNWSVKAARGFGTALSLRPRGGGPGEVDPATGLPPMVSALIGSHFSSVRELNRPMSTRDMSSVPLKIKGRVFGALHLFHPHRPRPMAAIEMSPFEALANEVSLYLENALLYEKIYDNMVKSFRTMVDMMESKDPYIKDHSKGVCDLACSIASKMGCSQEEIEMLNFACYFHDVGKVAIKDRILMNPGPLSKEDFETMKSHTVIGEKLLEPLELLPVEKTVIRHHHERIDGSGYPDGLVKEEMSLFARIVAVADVYDAMISHRCYRPAYPPGEVLEHLRNEAGVKFDTPVVEALESLVEENPHMASDQVPPPPSQI